MKTKKEVKEVSIQELDFDCSVYITAIYYSGPILEIFKILYCFFE